MQIRKVIISFILLIVYTAGVAHELIPHHQNEVKGSCEYLPEGGSELQHDIECGELTCFSHTDHCDDGVFDLLSCLFSDENHPDDDCINEVYLHASSNELSLDSFAKMKLTSVVIAVFNIVPVLETQLKHEVEVPTRYLSPPIYSSSNRGPPTLV